MLSDRVRLLYCTRRSYCRSVEMSLCNQFCINYNYCIALAHICFRCEPFASTSCHDTNAMGGHFFFSLHFAFHFFRLSFYHRLMYKISIFGWILTHFLCFESNDWHRHQTKHFFSNFSLFFVRVSIVCRFFFEVNASRNVKALEDLFVQTCCITWELTSNRDQFRSQ